MLQSSISKPYVSVFPQVRINKMVNIVSICTLPLQDQLQGYNPSHSYTLLRVLHAKNAWWIFSQNCIFHHSWEKSPPSAVDQKIWRRLGTLGYYFVWLVIFSNMMALHFSKYLSYSMVLTSLSLLRNHDNLILKLHQKSKATVMKSRFLIGKFEVGSVLGKKNKVILGQ